jgi:hypothetical protein
MAAAETGAVNVLNKAGSTRSDAMGGAATAVGRDATLVWLNPASIAQVTQPSITLAGQRGFFGESLGQALLAAPLAQGVMSFGCMYYNTGTIRTYNEAGDARTMTLQEDFMGAITYGLALTPALSVGATAKGLNSSMFDEVSSAALAVDLGAQYRITQGLKAGLSMQNFGTKLRYLDDEISLPAAVRGGLAYGVSPGGRDLVVLMGDAEYPVSGEGMTMSAGAEYQWNDTASLRAGIRLPSGTELATLSFGAGLVVQHYRLDYSVRLGKEFDSPQTLSLTLDFPRAPSPVAAQPAEQAVPAAVPTGPTGQESAPLTAPEILPGAPAPLPMSPAKADKKGKPAGMADDLNRELDELLKQTGEK